MYNLHELLSFVDLPDLDEDFSMEEIMAVLKDMPSDHASGPDGFNGAFFKKCWNTIKGDILRLCSEFANGTISLQSINASLITVIQ